MSQDISFSWCAMRDLNPHGRPLDPKSSASANSANRAYIFGDSTENRTRVTAVKGRCLDRLTIGPYEPATSCFPRRSPAKYHRR